jgi:hypothetical protein
MSSSGRIYLISTDSNTLRLSAFDFSVGLSTITPAYYKYFGSSPAVVATILVFDSTYSSVYIGGQTGGSPSITKLSLSAGTY